MPSYSGVWTLQAQMQAVAAGTWTGLPQLFAWGKGGGGVLGLNSTVYRSSPTQVGTLTNWAQIGAGNNSTAAVKTDGTLWSWGGNGDGQLGVNDTVYRSSPVQIGSLTTWSKISAGNFNALAIKSP